MVSHFQSVRRLDKSKNLSFSDYLRENWYKKLDLKLIAERYSTPLYICNRAQIIRNLQGILSLVKSPENILFPVKSNPCLLTLKTLAEQGVGADCASAHELELARMAGISSERISYYSPIPEIPLAASLLKDGGSVVLDAASHFEDLQEILGTDTFSGQLFLRINPNLSLSYKETAEYQKHTSHGDPSSQFGFPAEDVIALLKDFSLPLTGLHVHVGTQMDNVDVFVASLESLHQLCDEIHQKTTHCISVLNLGGGLGIPTHAEANFPSINEWVESLYPHLRPNLTYKVEPGNALIGNATGLLTKVETRKQTRGRGWAILDVGTNQLLKVTMAGFDQDVVTQDGESLPRSGPDGIAGPLCFAGDVILANTDLTGIDEGDLLFLPNTGTYCRSVGSRFNGRSEPGMLLVDDTEEVGLSHQKEDFFWEPTIQSFGPIDLPEVAGKSEIFYKSKLEKLRSVYLNKQCVKDDYQFHHFTRTSPGHYDVELEVDSLVAFISAPLVMRIISDAAVVAFVDAMGKEQKDLSVWGSRFTFAIDSILRTNHRHRLRMYLTENACPANGRKREVIAFWQLGKNKRCYGSLKLVG